jgi:hypothetical protein
MLGARTVLFAAWQAIIAGIFLLLGHTAPWEASIAWWPLTAALTNGVTIGLLAWLLRQEGRSLWTLYGGEGRGKARPWQRNLLLVLGVLVISLPLVYLPNIGLGTLLFGDAAHTVAIMFRPLPVWAAAAGLVLFPLTIGFAELPTYFGYVMPRLSEGGARPWLALVLAAAALSVQHAALPLVFDGRFLLWRAFMFLPFALFVGFALRRRPRLLPYMMVVHALLDVSAAWLVWSASVG